MIVLKNSILKGTRQSRKENIYLKIKLKYIHTCDIPCPNGNYSEKGKSEPKRISWQIKCK